MHCVVGASACCTGDDAQGGLPFQLRPCPLLVGASHHTSRVICSASPAWCATSCSALTACWPPGCRERTYVHRVLTPDGNLQEVREELEEGGGTMHVIHSHCSTGAQLDGLRLLVSKGLHLARSPAPLTHTTIAGVLHRLRGASAPASHLSRSVGSPLVCIGAF